MSLKIHGVPLSQPFRAVVWPCLIHKLPFDIILAVPGKAGKYATRRPEFLDKFPLGTIPSIEDDDGLCLSEAPAILAHLSRKHGWDGVYPPRRNVGRLRARLDEYCHWHHSNVRSLTRAYFRRWTVPHPLVTEEVVKLYEREAEHALKTLERVYFGSRRKESQADFGGGGEYLLGTTGPTAADFLAYEEIVQVSPAFGNVHSLQEYPNVRSWLDLMKTLPYHDEVHASLAALGDLNEGDPTERFGPATKAGLKALDDARKRSGCDGGVIGAVRSKL